MKKLKLVVSCKATGCTPGRISRLVRELERDYSLGVYELTGPGGYRNAVAPDDEIVAVAGGDGSVREIASLIYNSDRQLAIIPAGTANVVAYSLGIRRDADALACLRRGRTVDWGVFRANDDVFLLCVGAGIDAESCRIVNFRLKQAVRKGSYVWAFLRAVATYHFAPATVSCRPDRHYPQLMFLTCGYYAGGAQLTKSNPADSIIEIVGLGGSRPGFFLAIAHLFLRGAEHLGAGQYYHQVDLAGGEVTVTSADGTKIPYQIDGDFTGYLPVRLGYAGTVRILG